MPRTSFSKPKKFDNNLLVIGAGSGGLVAALIATTVNAKVTLIERDKMGGDCLNTGCVPSKTLLRSAKILNYCKRATEFGLTEVQVKFDFENVMERVRKVIKTIEPVDSVERYTSLGVNCIQGDATLTSPWTVSVNGQSISSRNIVIATGGSPLIPPIPGLAEIPYLTSETVWDLNQLPKRLAVIGGGPIGCELSQAFNRFGSEVTLLDAAPRIMTKEDPVVSEHMREVFISEGVDVRLNQSISEVKQLDDQLVLITSKGKESSELVVDNVLVAIGRRANTAGLGLEEIGVELSSNGTIQANQFLQTSVPSIYVCGDVAGPYQFTHTASHQAWYASVNPLFAPFKRFKADYSVIPWCTYTDPEVAHVGLSEPMALEAGIEYEATTYELSELDRALAEEEGRGFIKLITPPKKDRILGVTIVGHHAGDLLSEFVMAMKHGIGLKKIMGTIHTYPTLAEANKFVASTWRKKHVPEKLLEWVRHFHRLRR